MRYYTQKSEPFVSSYVGNKYQPDLYLKAGAMLEDRLNQAEAANAKFQETGELTPGYYTALSGEAEEINQKIRATKQRAAQAASEGKTGELTDALYQGQAIYTSPQAKRVQSDFEKTNKYITPEVVKREGNEGEAFLMRGSKDPNAIRNTANIPDEWYGLYDNKLSPQSLTYLKNFQADVDNELRTAQVPQKNPLTGEMEMVSVTNSSQYKDYRRQAFGERINDKIDAMGPNLSNPGEDLSGIFFEKGKGYLGTDATPGSGKDPNHPEWSELQVKGKEKILDYGKLLYHEEGKTIDKTSGFDKTGSQKLDGLFSLFGGAHVPLKAPEKAEAVIGAVADGMTGNKEIVGNNVEIVTQTIQGLADAPVSIGEHTLTSQDFYNKLLNSPDGQAVLSGQVTPESEDFLKSLWTSSAPFDYNVAKDMFMQTASDATANMEQAMTYSTIKEDIVQNIKKKNPGNFTPDGEFKNLIKEGSPEWNRIKKASTATQKDPGGGEYPTYSEVFSQEKFNKNLAEANKKANSSYEEVNTSLEKAFGNYSDFVTNAYSINDFPKADGGSINALNFAAQINNRDFLTSGEGGFDLKDFNSLTPIDVEKEYEGKNVRFDPETIYLNSKGKWITSGTLYDETDKNNPVILNEHAIGNVTNVLKGSVLSPTLEVAGNVYGKIKDNLHAVQEGGEFSFTQNGHKVTVKKGPKTGLEDTMYYSIDNGAYNKEASIFDASHVIGIVTSGASEEVAPGGKLQMKVLQEP